VQGVLNPDTGYEPGRSRNTQPLPRLGLRCPDTVRREIPRLEYRQVVKPNAKLAVELVAEVLQSGPVSQPGEGTVFLTAKTTGWIFKQHQKVHLESTDYLCRSYDVMIEPEGELIPGSQYSPG